MNIQEVMEKRVQELTQEFIKKQPDISEIETVEIPLEVLKKYSEEIYQAGRKAGVEEAIEIVESVKIISPSGVSDDILEPMQMLFDKEWKSKIKSSLTKLV